MTGGNAKRLLPREHNERDLHTTCRAQLRSFAQERYRLESLAERPNVPYIVMVFTDNDAWPFFCQARDWQTVINGWLVKETEITSPPHW